MATTTQVQLDPSQQASFSLPGITSDASKAASAFLTENHEAYHIFFNDSGFHNHISHHLLTLWALKASRNELKVAYDNNKAYQRPNGEVKESEIEDMHDPSRYKTYLEQKQYYNDFLQFFEREIDKTSWQEVLQKYLFSRTEQANDMLVRLFAGFLHPFIHLGFGIEFQQPAVIAESLAETAIHSHWIGDLLVPAEEASKSKGDAKKSIFDVLQEMESFSEIRNATRHEDDSLLRSLIERQGPKFAELEGQIRVDPSDIDRKTAELLNTTALFTAGAQRDDHHVRYDFFLMHCVNANIFVPTFVAQPWLADADKARLLEWKIRTDLALYVAMGSPEIRLDIVRSYKPKKPSGWEQLFQRINRHEDDGHGAKLVRALAQGQRVCAPYEDREEFRVKHDDWLQMGHMAVDSVEDDGQRWVRHAGFEGAWKDIPQTKL